ncbi:Uncharacterized protein dnl_48510 [Desulfonema limicola]|uniref:Uncharacterized protein n=1 Tax=Desulfonema limicola TaxID=45656 RepID=A0A975BBV1_9BACT|nr:Uncharacterized protein dnl_48510 [Desulfonema limicola]
MLMKNFNFPSVPVRNKNLTGSQVLFTKTDFLICTNSNKARIDKPSKSSYNILIIKKRLVITVKMEIFINNTSFSPQGKG